MKTLKILGIVGTVALFLGTGFNLINDFTEKIIFSNLITIPLFAIAVIGLICEIIYLVKNKKK